MTCPAHVHFCFLIVLKISSTLIFSLIHDALFLLLHVMPRIILSIPFWEVWSFRSRVFVRLQVFKYFFKLMRRAPVLVHNTHLPWSWGSRAGFVIASNYPLEESLHLIIAQFLGKAVSFHTPHTPPSCSRGTVTAWSSVKLCPLSETRTRACQVTGQDVTTILSYQTVCYSPLSGGSRAWVVIVSHYPPRRNSEFIETHLWVRMRQVYKFISLFRKGGKLQGRGGKNTKVRKYRKKYENTKLPGDPACYYWLKIIQYNHTNIMIRK